MRGELLNDGLSALAVGQGPPLVLLPGFGQGGDLSVRVPRMTAWSTAALATGFQRTVHLIHRPVRPPAGMTIATLAGWHATALRERFGEPADVMGISGGGVTALQLALDYPETVRRLALCTAASRVDERAGRDLLRLVQLEGAGRSGARLGSRLIAHGPVRDVTGRLGEIGVPVLVVGGTRDRVIPPETLRATAAGMADARLILLPGRGHATALYDPRAKPTIEAFLTEPAR